MPAGAANVGALFEQGGLHRLVMGLHLFEQALYFFHQADFEVAFTGFHLSQEDFPVVHPGAPVEFRIQVFDVSAQAADSGRERRIGGLLVFVEPDQHFVHLGHQGDFVRGPFRGHEAIGNAPRINFFAQADFGEHLFQVFGPNERNFSHSRNRFKLVDKGLTRLGVFDTLVIFDSFDREKK